LDGKCRFLTFHHETGGDSTRCGHEKEYPAINKTTLPSRETGRGIDPKSAM